MNLVVWGIKYLVYEFLGDIIYLNNIFLVYGLDMVLSFVWKIFSIKKEGGGGGFYVYIMEIVW